MYASEKGDAGYLQLHVHGPAGLSSPWGRLRFRRKSLAILYWLAYEGPTLRERLADLLWDTPDPLANLRVELSAINARLREAGLPGLPENGDPLVLPEGVVLDDHAVVGQPLEGLDGLGSDFQEWLDWRRARLRGSAVPVAGFDNLLDSLGAIRPPHLLVAETLPFSGAEEFAEALARRLRLPFSMHRGSPVGVRLTTAPYPEDAVARIIHDTDSVHVLERPFFGPDPAELLELRVRMRSADISYVRLPPLGWFAARAGPLSGIDFGAAADLFLKSDGHPGCLAEILDMPEEVRDSVPQKYRAALELSLRRLPADCRRALEYLAVADGLPGACDLLLSHFDDCIEELARQRWLADNGTSWEFSSMFAARLLRRSLPAGIYRAACRHVAALLSEAGDTPAATQLLSRLEGAGAPGPAEANAAVSSAESRKRRVHEAGRERFQEEPKPFGAQVEQAQGRLAFIRAGSGGEDSGVMLAPSGAPELLRLAGRRFSHTQPGERPARKESPLSVFVNGKPQAALGVAGAEGIRNGLLCLPLAEFFEYWFLVPPASDLVIGAHDPGGVIEITANFHELDENGPEREVWALDA